MNHPEEIKLQKPMKAGLGVLAHVTSLPGKDNEAQPGTFEAARPFIDGLASAGVRYWQILPLNPTDQYGSPYAGTSAFAGNVGLLGGEAAVERACCDDEEYRDFCQREADWLEPYACFEALRRRQDEARVWQDWPKELRHYDANVLAADKELADSAEDIRRGQFAFDRSWHAIRAYANERGVSIIGDMPIYVGPGSVDVWAHPELFSLDATGRPTVVAGCPPDAFAPEGQIWNNPLYNWDVARAEGFSWWLRRLERAFELYDFVRLDHFIGFSRYFSIPVGEAAHAGSYHPGPGFELFRAAHERFGPLPLIAEDLGAVTDEVRALLRTCGFPGMDVVQFASDPLAWYDLPPERIAYSGTHDNQTIVGYARTRYPELDAAATAVLLMEKVVASGASISVIPLQDLMGLDDDARMNVPGVPEGNWSWQADAAHLDAAFARARHLASLMPR